MAFRRAPKYAVLSLTLSDVIVDSWWICTNFSLLGEEYVAERIWHEVEVADSAAVAVVIVSGVAIFIVSFLL